MQSPIKCKTLKASSYLLKVDSIIIYLSILFYFILSYLVDKTCSLEEIIEQKKS